MLHPDEAGFLRAIAEAPQDRAPRLIYADWLDEHEYHHLAAFYRQPVPPPPPSRMWSPRLPRPRGAPRG